MGGTCGIEVGYVPNEAVSWESVVLARRKKVTGYILLITDRIFFCPEEKPQEPKGYLCCFTDEESET